MSDRNIGVLLRIALVDEGVAGPNRQFALAGHRILGVDHQIEDRGLDLAGNDLDLPEVRAPDNVEFNVFAQVLLRHKFKRTRRAVEARQHGHRGKRLTRASMMRRRTVAIEFGTWRSGRNGGSAGSVTVGNGKLREPRGGTRA